MDITKLLKEVAEREGCAIEEIEWYAWPQVFSTTAGPSGVGGTTPTTHQVIAFAPLNGRLQRYCCGKWRHWNGKFMQEW
jgi:hypothetical protein